MNERTVDYSEEDDDEEVDILDPPTSVVDSKENKVVDPPTSVDRMNEQVRAARVDAAKTYKRKRSVDPSREDESDDETIPYDDRGPGLCCVLLCCVLCCGMGKLRPNEKNKQTRSKTRGGAPNVSDFDPTPNPLCVSCCLNCSFWFFVSDPCLCVVCLCVFVVEDPIQASCTGSAT